MREFFTIAIFKIKADIRMNKTTLNSQKEKHSIQPISIHALLAESDRTPQKVFATHGYFYPRSPCGERRHYPAHRCNHRAISIHALLAESDDEVLEAATDGKDFYPRSPCGERRTQ